MVTHQKTDCFMEIVADGEEDGMVEAFDCVAPGSRFFARIPTKTMSDLYSDIYIF